jgi:hypothetical protein
MYMYRVEPATNLAVSDALKYSERYRLELTGMLHQDFSSLSMFSTQSFPTQTRTAETAKREYQTVCRYILNFFNAHLKKDERGLEFITRSPGENGVAESIARFEIRNKMTAPPTEEKFLSVMTQEGFGRAIELYNEARAKEPKQPVFSENFLNQLGYRLINQNRVGSTTFLLISGFPLSVPAIVGFIAVFGVAVQNGMVMVSYINKLCDRGMELHEAVITGASVRLRARTLERVNW